MARADERVVLEPVATHSYAAFWPASPEIPLGNAYNNLFKSEAFWEDLAPAETILVFQAGRAPKFSKPNPEPSTLNPVP